jgi:hypothetical protein
MAKSSTLIREALQFYTDDLAIVSKVTARRDAANVLLRLDVPCGHFSNRP